MKKKLLVGLLAVVMCFALVGCGKSENSESGNGSNNGGSNNGGSSKVTDVNSDGKIDFRDYLYHYAKNGGVEIVAQQTTSSGTVKKYVFTSDGKDIQVEWNGKKTYYDFSAKKVYVNEGSGWVVDEKNITKFDEGFEKIFTNRVYMSEISNSWTSYQTYKSSLEKVGSKSYAGRDYTEYKGNSGTYYVDNETELTLYQDASYTKLETTSFKTSASLSKPA